MQNFTIAEPDALEITGQTVAPLTAIQLVAVDYNWGPPVSGRFDVDFLQVWAAARIELAPRAVRLKGTYGPGSSWSNALEFQKAGAAGEHQLYLLDNAGGLCSEFVIEMETESGAVYYDNNGSPEANYRLVRYGGRGTSAVVGEGAIRYFADIAGYRLLARATHA